MNLFLSKILAGFVIGAGAIIPGLSGGILAVSMGLYQPTIEAITGFFKAPKKNFNFLLPLGIGGVIGFDRQSVCKISDRNRLPFYGACNRQYPLFSERSKR